MFVVNDDLSIYANRGDIVFFSVTADDNGTLYKFQPGDIVRMAIYGKKEAETCVMQKDFPVTEVTERVFIYLEEQDTKIGDIISKHKDYWYEVVLNPDTMPQTIIGYDENGAKVFRLFPESTEIDDNYEPKEEDFPVVDEELDMTSPRPIANKVVAQNFATVLDVCERTNKAVSENFVTPEMYGAIGDGKADDTESVQAAITANKSVVLNGTYLITDTIVIDSGKSYGVDGKSVRGFGTLVMGANKDCLAIKGCGNNVSGLTLKYHVDFYNRAEQTVSYTGALLSLVSETSILTNNNRIENVVLTPPYNDHNAPQYQMATGIKLWCGTGAYMYNNNFVDCKCYGMDTAIKIIHEGNDLGINANRFDVSAWCCDCYVDGFINGCIISGNCQSRNTKANGCLFRNFTGMNNVIDSYLFDVRYAGNKARHAVIDEAECGTGVLYNTFTAPIAGSSILNYAGLNRYNFITQDTLNVYTPWLRSSRMLTHRMMPYGNALEQCATSMKLNQGTATVSVSTARYPTYNANTKKLTDCSELYSKTVANREIYLQNADGETVEISFNIPSSVTLDCIFLEHQNLENAVCTIDGVKLTTFHNSYVASFLNDSFVRGSKVVISFNVTSGKTGVLKRISAVGYDANSGTF